MEFRRRGATSHVNRVEINNQNDDRPPGPTAEDILRMLFPPERVVPPDNRSDRGTIRGPDQPRAPSRQPQPRVPSRDEVASLSPYEQQTLLRKAVQSLDEAFDRIETGAGWQKHLQTDELGGGLWCGKSISPDAKKRAETAAIADRFDEVAGNSEYQGVSQLWGFQTIRAALREYANEPVELSKRAVQASS